METDIRNLIQIGMHSSLAAAVVHGCRRIKTIKGCREVTIPTLIQVDQTLIRDRSHTLHAGMVGLGVNIEMQQELRRYLWQHGVQYTMHQHHTVALYDESFEQELHHRSKCFKVDLVGKVYRSVGTDMFLNAIITQAKCKVHGLVSSHVVALAIRYRE